MHEYISRQTIYSKEKPPPHATTPRANKHIGKLYFFLTHPKSLKRETILLYPKHMYRLQLTMTDGLPVFTHHLDNLHQIVENNSFKIQIE